MTRVNRSALAIMGCRSAEQVVGRNLCEVVASPLNGHLYHVFREMLESKTPQCLLQTEWRRAVATNGSQGQGCTPYKEDEERAGGT